MASTATLIYRKMWPATMLSVKQTVISARVNRQHINSNINIVLRCPLVLAHCVILTQSHLMMMERFNLHLIGILLQDYDTN